MYSTILLAFFATAPESPDALFRARAGAGCQGFEARAAAGCAGVQQVRYVPVQVVAVKAQGCVGATATAAAGCAGGVGRGGFLAHRRDVRHDRKAARQARHSVAVVAVAPAQSVQYVQAPVAKAEETIPCPRCHGTGKVAKP